jgi:small subunit ribosomal protein S7
VLADHKIEKFVNYLMKDGKKTTARKVFADTMDEIKAAGHMNPHGVLFTAIENAAPSIMVKSKRV